MRHLGTKSWPQSLPEGTFFGSPLLRVARFPALPYAVNNARFSALRECRWARKSYRAWWWIESDTPYTHIYIYIYAANLWFTTNFTVFSVDCVRNDFGVDKWTQLQLDGFKKQPMTGRADTLYGWNDRLVPVSGIPKFLNMIKLQQKWKEIKKITRCHPNFTLPDLLTPRNAVWRLHNGSPRMIKWRFQYQSFNEKTWKIMQLRWTKCLFTGKSTIKKTHPNRRRGKPWLMTPPATRVNFNFGLWGCHKPAGVGQESTNRLPSGNLTKLRKIKICS